jgi:hypothetical protein
VKQHQSDQYTTNDLEEHYLSPFKGWKARQQNVDVLYLPPDHFDLEENATSDTYYPAPVMQTALGVSQSNAHLSI